MTGTVYMQLHAYTKGKVLNTSRKTISTPIKQFGTGKTMDLGPFIMSLAQAAKEGLNLVDEENTIKPTTVNPTNLTIYLSKSPSPLPPELPSDQPEMQDSLPREEIIPVQQQTAWMPEYHQGLLYHNHLQ